MQLASGGAVPLGPITMDVQYPYPLIPSISMQLLSPMQPSAAAQPASSAAATNTLLKSLAQAAQVAQQALQQVSSQLSMQVSSAQILPPAQMLPAASQAAAASVSVPSAPATSGTSATPSGASGTPGTSTIATSTTTSANNTVSASASSVLMQPSSLALMSPAPGVSFQQLQMPFPVDYATVSGGPVLPSQAPLAQFGSTSGPPPAQQMLMPNLASFMAYSSGMQPTLAPALPFGNLVGTSQKPPDENKSYWAKGTGYGHGNTTSQWNAEQSAQQRRAEESIITVYLEVRDSFLQCCCQPDEFDTSSHFESKSLLITHIIIFAFTRIRCWWP